MTGSLPQPVEGAVAPNTLELLWERNRRLVQGLFWVLVAGLLGYYALKYYEQAQVNAKWSKFASASLLHATYSPEKAEIQMGSGFESAARLLDDLKATPESQFESAIAAADSAQAPYVLWLAANHFALNNDLAKATQYADRLQQTYPQHPLVVEVAYPVQTREEKEKDKADEKDKKKKPDNQEPDLEPAVKGSAISMVLNQLKAAKDFVSPPHFVKPEIPADAPRYKITLEGDYGEFVVALLPAVAPKHAAKFQELVDSKFWEGIKVDEIARAGKSRWSDKAQFFHFGFETTKTEANRSDWDTTAASKAEHVVEEMSPLSHWPGALAARSREGKSEVDRLFVCVTDDARSDDSRQVFGYVVEGLEAAKRITEAGFDRSEDEDRGRGRPAENIAIKSVVRL